MPTTVNFDAIKVELRDALGNTISAQNNGSSKQRVIRVRPGEKFSVCVDFGEVTGRAPGSYSVRISLSVSAKKREKGWQRQDWCLGDSFEGGIVKFRSFRLWNYSYDDRSTEDFVMPRPDAPNKDKGNQFLEQVEGTIEDTVSRTSIGYGVGTAEDELRPEIPHGAMKQEDLCVSDDVFIVDPKTLTTKPPTAKANTQAVFIFRNIGQAYDSDEDPPSTKRRRSTVPPSPAVRQGPQRRAAAEKAKARLWDMKNYQEDLGKQRGSNTNASYGENGPLPQTPRKAQHSRAAGGQPSLPPSTHRSAAKDAKITNDLANEREGAPSNAEPPTSWLSRAAHDDTHLSGNRESRKEQHGALRPPITNEIACTTEGTTERDESAEDDGSEAQSCVGNAAPAAIMQEPDDAASEIGQNSKRSNSISRARRQASQGNPEGGKRKRSGKAATRRTAPPDSAAALDRPKPPRNDGPKISSPTSPPEIGPRFSGKAEEVDGVFVFTKNMQRSQPNPPSGGAGSHDNAAVKREPLGETPVKARTEQGSGSMTMKQHENVVGRGEEEDAATETAAQRAPEAPAKQEGTGPVAIIAASQLPFEENEPTSAPTIGILDLRIKYIDAQMRRQRIRVLNKGENVEDDERYAELDEEKHACEYKKGEMEEAQAARDRREKELQMSK